jgi:Tfp pilus assembly protein PilO
MDRKIKNTLALLVIFVLILAGGLVYTFVFQKSTIEEKEKRIKDLNLNSYNTEELQNQLDELRKRVSELDSILAIRKYNIPHNTDQTALYDFINRITFPFSSQSYVNIEYNEILQDPDYLHYKYTVSGNVFFNEFFKLVYAIEQSKELKKIENCTLDNVVSVNDDGVASYLVNFKMDVLVYFAQSDRFTSSSLRENRLTPNPLYDIFYPLIRNEIPPNTDNLPDIQAGQLLALIPDGAFIADASGDTYLLWEGDKVYLGYLTEIDFESNEVHFILNKGGIIEKVKLALEKEKKDE